ncbi:MAG: hypothetical protein ABFE08_15725 [Armatimonadia bacterium]
MRFRFLLPLLALVSSVAFAQYEYRYLEGESFARGETQGLRDEGFTSWMGHPSGGKVVIFGRPAGGFVEYDIEGLPEGEYFVHIRCLAIPSTRTQVLWDGQKLGLITHDQASTSLSWSKPLPLPRGAAPKHVLRLQGSDDTAQWPYIDTILLTNVKDYVPPSKDQDFISYTTPWPLLNLTGPAPEALAPQPPLAPAGLSDVTVQDVSMPSPVLGSNPVTVTLLAPQARKLTLSAQFVAKGRTSAAANLPVALQPNTPQTVTIEPLAAIAGSSLLALTLRDDKAETTGRYPVTLPDPATIALDESAYPATRLQGQWTATFNCSPDLLKRLQVQVTLAALPSAKPLWQRTVAAQEQVEVPLDLTKMPVGRYEITSDFRADGVSMLRDRREFTVFRPVPWPAWEPVRVSKAVGDTVTVNGKPFLARMVYHAAANETTVDHGYNVVQCFGSDPNPLDSIQNHLDACQKAGIYGAVALFNNQFFNKGPEFDLAHLEQAILRFKDHPALLCWDLIDEPEPTMKPEQVQAGADLIRRLDPNHFVWVNLCRNVNITEYLASQDLWSYDSYPFPQLTPFDYKTRWLNSTDKELLGKKPLGTCLQTYNYNRHEFRMPTPDELRTSAWLHVIHGYKWFGYYSYNDGEPAGCLARDPVLLSYCRALNNELVQLQDVVLAPGLWRPVSLAPETDKLEAREKEVNGKLYVVIVSDSAEPLTTTLKPSWASARRRLLVETEAKPVTGPFTTTIRPFATQVWELTH